jgi:hypothetical protein
LPPNSVALMVDLLMLPLQDNLYLYQSVSCGTITVTITIVQSYQCEYI